VAIDAMLDQLHTVNALEQIFLNTEDENFPKVQQSLQNSRREKADPQRIPF